MLSRDNLTRLCLESSQLSSFARADSCLVLMDRKRNQLSALKSYNGVLKVCVLSLTLFSDVCNVDDYLADMIMLQLLNLA